MADEEIEEKKGGSKLIIIIGAVVALAGGGAFFMMGGDKGEGEAAVEEVIAEEVDVARLKEEITISFIDDEGDSHYLLINMSYQTNTEKGAEYLSKKEPLIRQKINVYLLGLPATSITHSTGISKVKNKIFTILSNILSKSELKKDHQIKEVYIEKYIVQ